MNLQEVASTLSIFTSLVTILGLPALIGSVILLMRQVRIQTYQAIYESVLSVDLFLIQNPDLREYLYEEKPLPEKGTEAFHRAYGVSDMLLTFFEHVIAQKDRMSATKWKGWENYICDVYTSSPAIRHFFDEKKHWYSKDLNMLLSRAEAVRHEFMATYHGSPSRNPSTLPLAEN